MIARQIQEELLAVAREYKVVTLTGPRQSGKTTLVRNLFSDYCYVNLEEADKRILAEQDPHEFLMRYSSPAILDEIQRVPLLLSYIQSIVDNSGMKGAYILTGSHQPRLQEGVTQSLAGRAAILHLLPLSIDELMQSNFQISRDELLFRGFMPQLYNEQIDIHRFYRNYYQTYIERDLRQLINVRYLNAFELFLKLLAGRIGQIVNLNSLSNDIGVSVPTLAEWLSVLEASDIVFRLHPYYENFGKRLIKSPKLYFCEVGLACYLLGIENPEMCARDPLSGNLFENMVVVEALKARYNTGQDSNLYFFRDSNGVEVDLLLAQGRRLYPFEIKSSRTFHPDFIANLKKFQQWSGTDIPGTVIYSGDELQDLNGVHIVNFSRTAEHIRQARHN